MSHSVIVNGAEYTIMVAPPVVAIPPTTDIQLVVSSGEKLSGEGKEVAVQDDMRKQEKVSVDYTSPPFIVAPGKLEWDGVLKGCKKSEKLFKKGKGVISASVQSGEITWKVKTAAKDDKGNDDKATTYKGSWSLKDAGQEKLCVAD